MISAERFLDILEAKDLIPVAMLGSLRKQLAAATKPVTAPSVAKLLIEKGHLTPALAKRLAVSSDERPQMPGW